MFTDKDKAKYLHENFMIEPLKPWGYMNLDGE